MEKIVVTRHPALVRVMIKDGIIGADVPVIPHATPEDVTGRHVFGVLPLPLAALADRVTVPDLRVPPELRGKELTEEQIRKYLRGWRTFNVQVEADGWKDGKIIMRANAVATDEGAGGSLPRMLEQLSEGKEEK